MHVAKRFFRWAAHKLSIALLANAVTVGIPLLAFSIHVTNPDIVKGWLSDTSTYETLIDQSLNLIALESDKQEGDEGSLGETLAQNPNISIEDITGALAATITPELAEQQTEGVIDGTYAWLDGATEEPEFAFSLSSQKDELAERLTETLGDQLKDLPACTPEEASQGFSLIEALCKPDNINIDTEINRFVAEFTGDDGLFGDSDWTQENLIQREGEESGLTKSNLEVGQQAFTGLKSGPYILLVAGAIGSVVVYLTSRNRYRGFSEVGHTLFSGSLFTFATAIVVARFENLVTYFIGENDSSNATLAAARSVFEPLLQRIVHDVASLAVILSGATLVVGAFMVGISLHLKKKYRKQESQEIEREWKELADKDKVKEIKKAAKKHSKKYSELTKDPETKKPLKSSKERITVQQARKIALDPASKKKPVSEIAKETKKK